MLKAEKIVSLANYAAPAAILLLSVISATDLCTGGCSSLSDYRLFGMPFLVSGVAYALMLMASVIITTKLSRHQWTTDILVAAGLGAEIYFIAIQKFVVKKWCPVCLTIAGTLALFAILRAIHAYRSRDRESSSTMTHGKWLAINAGKAGAITVAILAGFFISISAVGKKEVALSAQASALESAKTPASTTPISKQDVWFGNQDSPIVVYFVSDWYCDYCQKVEPAIEAMLPDLDKKVKYTWIDMTVHRESLNISPYAIHALVHAKPKYLQARRALFKLAKPGKPLKEEQIKEALAEVGIPSDLDKNQMQAMYQDGMMIARFSKVVMTPSAVIVDTRTNERKILSGASAITKENILAAAEGATNAR